jgi:uncharacterized protein (TIGR02246 family)
MTNNQIVDVTTAEAGVRQVILAMHTAWAANDADAFASLYEPDASVVVAGTYRSGRDQIRDHMVGAFAGPFRGSTLIEEVRSIRFPTDDTAIVVSESGIVFPGADSVAQDRMVRATWTLHLNDAGWLVSAYAGSPFSPI